MRSNAVVVKNRKQPAKKAKHKPVLTPTEIVKAKWNEHLGATVESLCSKVYHAMDAAQDLQYALEQLKASFTAEEAASQSKRLDLVACKLSEMEEWLAEYAEITAPGIQDWISFKVSDDELE